MSSETQAAIEALREAHGTILCTPRGKALIEKGLRELERLAGLTQVIASAVVGLSDNDGHITSGPFRQGEAQGFVALRGIRVRPRVTLESVAARALETDASRINIRMQLARRVVLWEGGEGEHFFPETLIRAGSGLMIDITRGDGAFDIDLLGIQLSEEQGRKAEINGGLAF